MRKRVCLLRFSAERDKGGKGVGHLEGVPSNALRLGAKVTSNGFSTASLDLKKKQKEKEEKKQHKKVMEKED